MVEFSSVFRCAYGLRYNPVDDTPVALLNPSSQIGRCATAIAFCLFVCLFVCSSVALSVACFFPIQFRVRRDGGFSYRLRCIWPFRAQRGGDWAGLQPAQAPPRCTKCNSPCTHQRPVYIHQSTWAFRIDSNRPTLVQIWAAYTSVKLKGALGTRGGAPIGAGGPWSPPLFEAKGTGGHNLGIIY